jgi:hypothetical protein
VLPSLVLVHEEGGRCGGTCEARVEMVRMVRALKRARRIVGYRPARRRFLRERLGSNPVVVYTLGKTGSTAVIDAVEKAGRQVVQVHHLARLDEVEREVRRTRPGWHSEQVFAGHLLRSMPATAERPWQVISLVREPLALSVSAFFQTGERLRHFDERTTPDDVDVLRAAWLDADPLFPLRWFDEELRTTLGIDVYAHPFDPEMGWAMIDAPHARVLLLRRESLTCAHEGLTDLLGLAVPPVEQRHASAAKGYGQLYTRFVEGLTVAPELLDAAYGSRMATHFYSPCELAAFRRRWA